MDGETTSGANPSCWLDVEPIEPPPLAGDAECDVCVVGGGIAGLACAYRLAEDGRSVVVLEDGRFGSGETGRTTAHLASALDDRFVELERRHGLEGARLAYDSHAAAIDWIEGVAADEAIACEFARVDGWLFVPPGDATAVLDDELAGARRVGFADVERRERVPGLPFDTGPCLRFPRQARLHPLRFLAGLARACVRLGARLHGRTHAAEIRGGAHPTVRTAGGATVRARAVVVATNVPVNDRVLMHPRLEAYRSYVIAFALPRGAVADGLFWDTGDPYHYVRLAADGERDLLLVGGEDHPVACADDQAVRYRRLEQWTRERFPACGGVAYRWSGQIVEPIDDLAYIGRNPHDRNVYIATGDSGNGLTHGAIAALLIADLIAGRPNRWAVLYDPSRSHWRAFGELASWNAHVAAQYADWFTAGEDERPAPGCGVVQRRGARKVAVYREPGGARHACSAVCPHLRAIVRWNADEGTWDCPAHGSRFAPGGQVVNGPANRDLAAAEDPVASPGDG